MTTRITAERAHQITNEALGDLPDISKLVDFLDKSIGAVAHMGYWSIRPVRALRFDGYEVTASHVKILRQHYEERGFQWKESMKSASQGKIKLSWENERNANSD